MADRGYIYSYRAPNAPDLKKPGKYKYLLGIIVICLVVVFAYKILKPGNKEEKANTKNVEDETTVSDVQKDVKTVNIDYKQAEGALKKEDFVRARDLALKTISTLKENDPLCVKFVDILNKANTALLSNDIPCPEKKVYTIKEGDNLIKIAKKFNTTIDAIQNSNKLDPSKSIIFPGKTLYIFTGKWNIKISRKKFKLYLFNGDKLFKVYNIGIGKHGRTPMGTFEISLKKKEPTWYPEGRKIPYGTKENVLGTRWMAVKPTGKTDSNLRGYGIHGTWEPESIGKASSNGCIRLRNEEVNELYSIVPMRSTVVIED